MCDQANKISVLEGDVRVIKSVLESIKSNQEKILDNNHQHELESERYRVLIDELIDEKKAKIAEAKSKVAARSAIVDKLIVAGVITGMGIILTLAWDGLIEKIAHWG